MSQFYRATVLLSDIMPLPSHGENCGKGRAEGLYDLAYQRPQPPQKGQDRTRGQEELINSTHSTLALFVNILYSTRTLPRVHLPSLHSA
jgi:hypothetical protein